MKNLFIAALVICFGCLSTQLSSQNYNSAVGLRLGSPVSVSYKHFINEQGAIEAYVGYRNFNNTNYSWINIGAAYQMHNSLDDVFENLSWYYGGGASVFIFNYGNDFGPTNESSTGVALQGYIGLDYKFPDAPVNLSLDWVPTFLLSGFGNGFGADYGAISVRYVINE